jgi:RNA polymerase sigma-70 factor (ECF subfamily)
MDQGVVRWGDADRVESFRELYDVAYPKVMAYALRRAGNREDALDAVSETFVVVWRRLENVPGEGRAMAWVYGVARRVLANQYRSRDRRASLENRLKDDQTREPGEESFDVVHEALARLRVRDREILTLAAWDDLDNAEIAEVLGVSERNVAVRLHRARKRLALELGKLGMHHPPKTSDQVKSEGGYRTPNGVNGTHLGPGEVETP